MIPLQPQGDKVDITSKTAYHLTTVPLMVQGAQVALHGIQAQMLGGTGWVYVEYGGDI